MHMDNIRRAVLIVVTRITTLITLSIETKFSANSKAVFPFQKRLENPGFS